MFVCVRLFSSMMHASAVRQQASKIQAHVPPAKMFKLVCLEERKTDEINLKKKWQTH